MNLCNDRPIPANSRLCFWHPDYKPEPFVKIATDYDVSDFFFCPICEGNFIVCGHEYSNGFQEPSATSARSDCNTRTKIRYPVLFQQNDIQNNPRTKPWYTGVNGQNDLQKELTIKDFKTERFENNLAYIKQKYSVLNVQQESC